MGPERLSRADHELVALIERSSPSIGLVPIVRHLQGLPNEGTMLEKAIKPERIPHELCGKLAGLRSVVAESEVIDAGHGVPRGTAGLVSRLRVSAGNEETY